MKIAVICPKVKFVYVRKDLKFKFERRGQGIFKNVFWFLVLKNPFSTLSRKIDF